jgi:hypothetical protein
VRSRNKIFDTAPVTEPFLVLFAMDVLVQSSVRPLSRS